MEFHGEFSMEIHGIAWNSMEVFHTGSELSFTQGHLGSHHESLLGLQSTGLFMIVKFKILWYYELTIPCVVFEKSINVCLVFPRGRTLQIDRNRSSKT